MRCVTRRAACPRATGKVERAGAETKPFRAPRRHPPPRATLPGSHRVYLCGAAAGPLRAALPDRGADASATIDRPDPLVPSFIDPPADADLLRIPVGPGAVHVERYGHGGAPIVLLHGFPTSSFVWRLVGPQLASAGFTAYALDLFGYGESDRPFDADFGIEAQAEYVDRAMTALRLADATVVGLDRGAAGAIRLAAPRPARVERLVLVNTLGFDFVPGRDIRSLQRNTARFALRLSRDVLGVAPLLAPVLEGSVASLAHMPARLVARSLAPFVGRDPPADARPGRRRRGDGRGRPLGARPADARRRRRVGPVGRLLGVGAARGDHPRRQTDRRPGCRAPRARGGARRAGAPDPRLHRAAARSRARARCRGDERAGRGTGIE